MKIKICGLKRIEDVDYVNQSCPDYIGFVFAGVKRKIDFETAQALKQRLDDTIPAVGVFVNADIGLIRKLVEAHVIDVVQLHGDEDLQYINALCAELKSRVGDRHVPIVKAVRVVNMQQVQEADRLPVDYLLLDAFKEDEYGGSGKVFDHTLIPKLSKPYFLAGGISTENVLDILNVLQEKGILPYCIDVSSSVETAGVKDKEKIAELVRLVKQEEL